jgi:phage terminase large subunit-like protein
VKGLNMTLKLPGFRYRSARALHHERAAPVPNLMELGLPAPYRVEQLIHFPLAAHDDGPDALAGTSALLLKGTRELKYWCRGGGEHICL